MITVISFVGFFLFTSNFILFYLDGFRLSSYHIIKYIQNLSFFAILLYSLYYIFEILDIIFHTANINKNNDINLLRHISIDKEVGKALSQGMNSICSNIGLDAIIIEIATAVDNTITKSSLPLVQKAGVVVGASIIGSLFYSKVTTIKEIK